MGAKNGMVGRGGMVGRTQLWELVPKCPGTLTCEPCLSVSPECVACGFPVIHRAAAAGWVQVEVARRQHPGHW